MHPFVLGGGGGPRDLGELRITDMELIDPTDVELPSWYRPDNGRASDLAFIVFTGQGEQTRMSRISNRRWAQSAFGTASSAALTGADTVYSVTPLYHPSGLMMGVGGAIAGGARLALASTFRPSTFWDEARRYGVTVASYTWTLLHELVEAPPHPGERHHAVRLFIGSGMPRGLWRRVQRRFKPARVLEFYASTETGAILVNLRDAKPGSMGRPLPGSAEVRIGAYEIESAKLLLGRDGFVEPCGVNEIGMLLTRVRAGAQTSNAPLRGVFARDDAWLATGDLFRRDPDGDYWRIDSIADVVAGRDGPVFTTPIRDALGDLSAVDLAVAYGVRVGRLGHELVVGAVTVRAGQKLAAADIGAAVRPLESGQRPAIVRVVDQIPVTTWFRPLTAPLLDQGIPQPTEAQPVWYLDRGGITYRPLTQAARRRLTAAVS